MNSTMLQRVLSGMGAHSVGMAISIGIQLASLPLFLIVWNLETYGMWLLISAMPTYLAMADVGMVTAAGNRMTMATGAGDTAQANRIFQSAQAFMAVVSVPIAIVALPIIWWMPWPVQATPDHRVALMALTASVLVTFAGGLSEQVFKATHRYALGTLLNNLSRLAEWAGWMLGLLVVGSFTAVAVGGLIFRIVGTILTMVLTRATKYEMAWGTRNATRETVQQMIGPAAGFMAFPLANALSFQGVTLLVGALFGPATLAIFSTFRTLARTAVQITAMLSHSLWPEFSRLFGQGSAVCLRRLVWRSSWLNAVQVILLNAVLYTASPWLLQLWTHGKIASDPKLMGLLLVYAAIGGLWHVPRVLLLSTNQHSSLAFWMVLTSALCISLSAWLGESMGLTGVVSAMLLSEFLIALICTVLAQRAVAKPCQPNAAMP